MEDSVDLGVDKNSTEFPDVGRWVGFGGGRTHYGVPPILCLVEFGCAKICYIETGSGIISE